MHMQKLRPRGGTKLGDLGFSPESEFPGGKDGPSGPHLHLNDTPLSVKYPRHL